MEKRIKMLLAFFLFVGMAIAFFYPWLEEKVIDVVFILFVGDEILFNKSLYGRYHRTGRWKVVLLYKRGTGNGFCPKLRSNG